MANKKNITVKKKVVKNEKNDKKKEVETLPKTLKKLAIISGVVLVVFLLMYLLTLGAKKLGWFDPRYTAKETENAQISYETILGGTMFDRKDSEYYVVIGDMDNNSTFIKSIITLYKEKENHLPVYIVDLSDKLNGYMISEEESINSSNVNDLKIKDFTLIKVSNGSNVYAISGADNISEYLDF